MSVPRYPGIELVQTATGPQYRGPPPSRRWKVFFGVLIVAAAAGTAIVYARSPIYRASVSVLTVKPKAVDMPSAEADVEHVAIQERLLLGEELLGRLAERLRETGDEPVADRNALRDLLSVIAVPETNLLELRAQGGDPALLQRVVNAWTASYETYRLEEIDKATGRTSAQLQDELRELRTKIEGNQVELRAFKSANDIISLERGENRELAALKGLNDSLNKARERLIEARARKAAIDDAIARGEIVVPNEQKAEVARMRVQVERMRGQLAELRGKYTDLYLARDPAYKDLPAEIEEHQKALLTALEVGRTTVRDEAQQALEAARLSVATLQEQLETDQVRVQQFTERFNDYKVLEDGLASLQRLAAERDERLAQIEVQNQQKFPPIEVVERAALPERPIGPDYERDLAIALAAALVIALFVTWLMEYLTARPAATAVAPTLGVRISPAGVDPLLASDVAAERLPHHPASGHALSDPRDESRVSGPGPAALRELSRNELEAVFARLQPAMGALATLLLSGIAPYELGMLEAGCFDRHARQIRVPGTNRREIVLAADAWQRIEALLVLTPQARSHALAELDLHLTGAAHEAGLDHPVGVTAFTLWYSYLAHLVRQGIDETALTGRVGAVPLQVRHTLAGLAHDERGARGGVIEYTHPALGRA